jgi:hypothetical protein
MPNDRNAITNRIIHLNSNIMSKSDYVPRTHSGFNSWQQTIAQFVATNAAAWGVSATLAAELATRTAAFALLYAAIGNHNTRTLQQVSAFNEYRIGYTTFLRQLVQGQLVNNPVIPYDEKIAMGLHPRSGARPERPTIVTHPVLSYTGFSGGLVQFECTNSSDGRAARPVNSDGVELYITVESSKPAGSQPLPLEAQPEPTPAVVVQQRTVQSSKTRFNYQFGLEERGMRFSVYGRWYNNNDRKKDGPVGPVMQGYIS